MNTFESPKAALRHEILAKRKLLDPMDISSFEIRSVPRLENLIRQLTSGSEEPLTVMSYMSYNNEFPTLGINHTILGRGWQLVLPFTDADFNIIACRVSDLSGLRESGMGIYEPDPETSEHVSASDADIILLPGVAFDARGMRLGYGRGCYDRFLSRAAGRLPVLVALAWDFQIVDELPAEEHDIPCDFIFTEKGVIPCSR